MKETKKILKGERNMLNTKKFSKTNLEKLSKEIDNVIEAMEKLEKASDEYKAMADNLERLYKAKSYDTHSHISPDTIAVVAGNLLGLVLIMNYEKMNVISTKALGFVLKGRV